MYYGGVSFSGADAAEIQLLPSPQRETRHVSPSQVHAETVAEQLSEETGRFEDMVCGWFLRCCFFLLLFF